MRYLLTTIDEGVANNLTQSNEKCCLTKSKSEKQKTKANRKKEPYRASMEAMEPPGTYSMKMFTTPPSKQVPMNLRVIVRKSFTNDKEQDSIHHKFHVYSKR